MTNQVNPPLHQAETLDVILEEAEEREKQYDWLEAVEEYGKAQGQVSEENAFRKADFSERQGYALYRAAMQAEKADEFRERMHHSISSYQRAKEFYDQMAEPGGISRALRCQAMIRYLSFWLASEVPEKKRLLHESWQLTKEALQHFESAGEPREYGETYAQLSNSAEFEYDFEADGQERRRILGEALEHGERAITLLSEFGPSKELARAYVKTASHLSHLAVYHLEIEDSKKFEEKALGYWVKAKEISEETAFIEISDMAFLDGGSDMARSTFERALEYCRKTGDRFIMGSALDLLAFHTAFGSIEMEDPDERSQRLQKALKHAEEAKQYFMPIGFTSPGAAFFWVEAPYAEYYWMLALHEVNLQRRRELLKKAVEAGPNLFEQADRSGGPNSKAYAHHVYSKVLSSVAKIETDPREKRSLLEEALEHRIESNRDYERLQPFRYYGLGIIQNYLADIKAELADLAEEPLAQSEKLQEAVLAKEDCLKLFAKEIPHAERTSSFGKFAGMGRVQYEYGHLLNRLFEFTKNTDQLIRAATAFKDASEFFERSNSPSRVAECHWRGAQTYDALEEHLEAAQKFLDSSDKYRAAAEKIPQLKDLYHDHARYMEAWSEIEKAKHHHERQDYGSAKEFYEKAASLHKSTKEWSFLTPNYSALAQVENGEELSRKERGQEAIQAFHQAIRLFNETRTTLQAELSKIESVEKKQMVASLVKGAALRRDYCMGRIALEEAKLLDRKGDYSFSSQKYGHAAETFEKVAQSIEFERERMEVKLIATVSRAWQVMIKAEAEASPELYKEASTLFEEVKELSPNEKAKSLALGHSRFCRALEAGTRFADTGDPSLHPTAIQHLESSSKYYLKAGFQEASEYAEATEFLFDAYLHMDEAKREKDHEKKTKLYAMTEKVLQASAESFQKAQHPAKRQEVLRLLEKVKKERELALSLTEVLHAPVFVSATTAFSAPTPARERAVGLERFEHADVRASLITRPKSLKVGEDLVMEIELVNAGKGPAQLVKVEELVPEGFELTGKPEPYRVEDSYLNMKGRRLDPLKTEEVRLVLKPKVLGQFTLKPRILYLDESGKYKTHEPEPVEITVRELGISGWVKGR